MSGYVKYRKPHKNCPSLTHLHQIQSPHSWMKWEYSWYSYFWGKKQLLSTDEMLYMVFANGGGADASLGTKPPWVLM